MMVSGLRDEGGFKLQRSGWLPRELRSRTFAGFLHFLEYYTGLRNENRVLGNIGSINM